MPEPLECQAWCGNREEGGWRCRRPAGHPDKTTDGIGHAPEPLPLVAEENVEDVLRHIESLHAGVHKCGAWWWNPERKPGASIAEQGPCPTLTAARVGLAMLVTT